jgi:uncharacterized metal-binding protein YceD (DUF177 family)
LLALYGVDDHGRLYIEMKVYKQQMVYGHMVAILRSGEVKLFCRECHRWYTVTVTEETTAVLQEIDSPVQEEASDSENP